MYVHTLKSWLDLGRVSAPAPPSAPSAIIRHEPEQLRMLPLFGMFPLILTVLSRDYRTPDYKPD